MQATRLGRRWGREATAIALGALAVLALVAGAPRQVTGDGVEYIAYASNLASLRAPSLTEADVESVVRLLRASGEEFGGRLQRPPLASDDGRHALTHFWLYPALVAPVWKLLAPLGMHPTVPFTVVNAVLLLLAGVALRRHLRLELALLLVGGPILWWIDKAQVEVFVFALGAIAFTQVGERPWLALVLAGAVAAQFPPFAVVLVGLLVGLWLRGLLVHRRTWAGLAVGAALAASHPAYFLRRAGVLTPLEGIGGSFEVPTSLESLGAVVWDPNVGLLANAPLLAIALLAAAASLIRRDGLTWPSAPGALTALLALPVLLLSFAAPHNFDHGGTPGMNRWLMVLLPLAVPMLHASGRAAGRQQRAGASLLAVASCAWSIVFFRPAVPEQQHVPTRLAAAQWTYYPSLHDPLPEIFGERLRHSEPARFPAATHGCTKVLLLGANWPVPCVPAAELPPACARPGALCYANWTGSRYAVRRVPGSAGEYRFAAEARIWPLPQASAELAIWELAQAGLECRQIGRRLGIPGPECSAALRRMERRGPRAADAMRGRLAAHRRALSRIQRQAGGAALYERMSRLPGPRAAPLLARFLREGDMAALKRLAVGDPEGLVRSVDGAPWVTTLEDDRRLLVYVPARTTAATVTLRLRGRWSGALLHADDGTELRPIEVRGALAAYAAPGTGTAPASAHRIAIAASTRDAVLVLLGAG